MKKIALLMICTFILSTLPSEIISAETEFNDNSIQTTDNTDSLLSDYYKILNPFIEENYKGLISVVMEPDAPYLSLIFDITDSDIKFPVVPAIENIKEFMAKNNLERSYVWFFTRDGNELYDDGSQTLVAVDEEPDINEYLEILSPFIEENYGEYASVLLVTGNPGTEHVAVVFDDSENETDHLTEQVKENIKMFMSENNIYAGYVKIISMAKGDVNLDGRIDLTDLSEISLAVIGDRELTAVQLKNADINESGKADLADLSRLKQYISNRISSLR